MKLQNPQLRELFKTPKRKTYTLVGITALIVGIFVLFSLRPTFMKIADLNKEIKDKEEFLDKLDSKLRTVNSLINQKRAVEEELVYFEEDFPTEEKTGFLVANLSAIAEKFDLDLMRVEFDERGGEDVVLGIEHNEDVEVLVLNINLEGNLSDIERYIEYLESFPRLLDIQYIIYSKAELSRYEGDLESFQPIESNVSMHVFYWSESGEKEAET